MKIKEVFDVVVAASKMISSMHCISNTEYPLLFALPKKNVFLVTKTVQNKKKRPKSDDNIYFAEICNKQFELRIFLIGSCS